MHFAYFQVPIFNCERARKKKPQFNKNSVQKIQRNSETIKQFICIKINMPKKLNNS